MKLIEKEIVIAADGKLPLDFREAFGRKARVAVYLQEQEQGKTEGADFLSDLVGKIQAFRRRLTTRSPCNAIFGTHGNVVGINELRAFFD